MTEIKDGTGTGKRAKVNNENRLETNAVSTEIDLHQVEDGLAFNINTGIITLTDAVADTAVLYFKNTDTNNVVVTSAVLSSAASTAGADNVLHWKQVGNFDASSDIIANGTPGAAINRNTGVSRLFSGLVTIGGTGRSFTNEAAGQQAFGEFIGPPVQIALTNVIPVGGEFGVTIDPPSGNTSMRIMLSINFHIQEDL